ncbi:MAG: hypothetical protein LBQ35_07055 [Spirochaetaceae bacterium]|nr:hypothetical protein [Spirochaetaceae bacterium]
MNGSEESENIIAILQRLDKIEALLERIDREGRNDETWKAAFTVKWDQLMLEHSKNKEHIKENWERLNRLEDEPVKKKARLWDTVTGRVLVITGTAAAAAVITHLPAIVKLFLG